MSQLLENTYNAYESFLEGEINEYDLMSLVEEGIISGEVLESMLVESGLVDVEEDDEELEEGFIDKVRKYSKPLVVAGTLAAAGSVGANVAKHHNIDNLSTKYQKHLSSEDKNFNQFTDRFKELHKRIKDNAEKAYTRYKIDETKRQMRDKMNEYQSGKSTPFEDIKSKIMPKQETNPIKRTIKNVANHVADYAETGAKGAFNRLSSLSSKARESFKKINNMR